MWATILFVFGGLAVVAALLFGWAIPILAIVIAIVAVAAGAVALRLTSRGPEPAAESPKGKPTWRTKHWWQ